MARNILVFNTITNTPSKVENFQGNTWGELKRHLSGYDKSMVAMIKENKTNLEHDGAELPVGIGKDSRGNPNGSDFTLFLMAGKVKSGNYDLTIIKSEILSEMTDIINEKFKMLDKLFEERINSLESSDEELENLAKEAQALQS